MSVTREITLWCDANDCYEWCQFNDFESHGGKVSPCRRVARKHGWTFSRAAGDRCPKHPAS